MINPYVPPDWVVAVVMELKPDGEHGPFAFARAIKSSQGWLSEGENLSFSYRDPKATGPPTPENGGDIAWDSMKIPKPGQVIVLGDCEIQTEGWRAGFATRYWKPYHMHPDIQLKNNEREKIKRKNHQQK